MNAGTLNCPSCGAAAPADATECAFCHAKLATIGCPSCFGLVFAGAKFCDHCGAKIESAQAQGESHKCPRGCGAMQRVTLGNVQLDECPHCNGLWLDPETFDLLLAAKEQSASALFGDAASAATSRGAPAVETVRYVPCPICGKLMNRQNFARSSGVIVDTCRNHGVWFDADELRRVIEFVRGGGLETSRRHQLDELAEERRLRDLSQSLHRPADAELMPDPTTTREGSAESLLTSFVKSMLG